MRGDGRLSFRRCLMAVRWSSSTADVTQTSTHLVSLRCVILPLPISLLNPPGFLSSLQLSVFASRHVSVLLIVTHFTSFFISVSRDEWRAESCRLLCCLLFRLTDSDKIRNIDFLFHRNLNELFKLLLHRSCLTSRKILFGKWKLVFFLSSHSLCYLYVLLYFSCCNHIYFSS